MRWPYYLTRIVKEKLKTLYFITLEEMLKEFVLGDDMFCLDRETGNYKQMTATYSYNKGNIRRNR